MSKGTIVVLEGFEGCGKSTIASKMAEILERDGYGVELTRQPGGTWFAEDVRNLILNKHPDVSQLTQTYALIAARQDLYDRIVKPALADNKIVICDRHYHSGLVLQPEAKNVILNNRVFEPEVLVFAEASFDTCMERQRART